MGIRKFVVSVFLTLPFLVNTQALAFTQVIVFGDSLSDDGNIAHRARDLVGFSYPSSNFNYGNYRFTDDTNTSPAANLYTGTWHEQLAKRFLSLATATMASKTLAVSSAPSCWVAAPIVTMRRLAEAP